MQAQIVHNLTVFEYLHFSLIPKSIVHDIDGSTVVVLKCLFDSSVSLVLHVPRSVMSVLIMQKCPAFFQSLRGPVIHCDSKNWTVFHLSTTLANTVRF